MLTENMPNARAGINIVSTKDGTLALVHGRFDIDSSPSVCARLLALLETPHSKTISVDLSGVTHIDSSGIATLVEALKLARTRKIELKVQGVHDQLLHLFEFSGVWALFGGSTLA